MAIVDQHQQQPLEEILEDLLPRIQHVFSRFHIPPRDAETVLRQTLLTYLYKKSHILDAERWLMGTLRSRCLLYWRDRRHRVYTSVDEALLASVAQSRESPEQRRGLLRDLNSALAKIPRRYRGLLWSRYRRQFGSPENPQPSGHTGSGIERMTERCLAALTRGLVADDPVHGGCDD